MNTKSVLTIMTVLGLSFPHISSAEGTIPAQAVKIISETVDTAHKPVLAGIAIANEESDSDKNFAIFAKKLSGYGFGKAPITPPWARGQESDNDADLSEEDKLAAEDRKKEMAERIKRLGQYDIQFLQKIDANKDLKTDGDEIKAAMKSYLESQLADKLKVDNDKDLRLTIFEYALAVPAKGKKDKDGLDWHQKGHFKHDDKNSDGYLDLNEMMGHDTRGLIGRSLLVHLVFLLPDADKDGDGSISKEEFDSLGATNDKMWATVSPDGEPFELKNAYPSLYWLPNEAVASLLPK